MNTEKNYKTDNFNIHTDKKLACDCGNHGCDKRALKIEHLRRLQLIRDDIGRPLIVTSGGRCGMHDRERNKATKGDHYNCDAVDIACDSELMKTKLLVLAGRHGATRVAHGAGFVHISWAKTNRTDVPTWDY